MQLIINNSGEINEFTEQLLKEKLEKLTSFYDRIETATVHVRPADGSGGNQATMSVRLAIPGPDVVAEATEKSAEKCIAEVTEKLRRQLRKVKEKQSGH
ncbi:MAG: ribosome-associated translation inhibitor RaiA [Bacteroidota bacterium]